MSELTILSNVGGSGVNVPTGSKITAVTVGSASDTKVSIASSGSGITADVPLTVTDFGTIAGAAGSGVFFVGVDGTVMNGSTTDSTASITGSSAAVYVEGGSGPTALTNYGSLLSPATGIDDISTGALTVDNVGKVIGTKGNAIFSDGFLTLSNLGSVANGSGSYGITADSGGDIVNGSAADLTASISAGDDAILIEGANASKVTNFGKIDGSNPSVGAGIVSGGSASITIVNGSATDKTASIVGSVQGISVGGVSAVTNFGSIAGTNVGVDLGNGGSVTNGSNADITASITGPVRIAGSGPNALSNFGSIAGGASISSGSVTNGSSTDRTASISGGLVLGGSGDELTNYGTITGGDAVQIAGGTVVNYGTIASSLGPSYPAISFTAPGGTLIAEPGSKIIGTILGESASTLEIVNSSPAAPTGANVSGAGFGAVIVAAGATWTVSSAEVVPKIVDDGTIAIVSGESLDVSDALNPSSTGLFELTGKSSLEIAAILGSGTKIAFLAHTTDNELIVAQAGSFGTHVGTTSYAGPLLEDFAAGDVIDLKGIASTRLTLTYAKTTGDLQIVRSGASPLTLAFQNTTLGTGSFHVASDGSGGTLLTHS